MNTRKIGTDGENLAAQYLKKHGYKILERNFTCHFGEIDIIAQKNGMIVFVEVKSRATDAFGQPIEAVNYYKRQTIVKCANRWLYVHKCTGVPVRFDVVDILQGEITHITDAFRP